MQIELIGFTLSILHNQTFFDHASLPKDQSLPPKKDNRGHPEIHQLNEQERREAMEKKRKVQEEEEAKKDLSRMFNQKERTQ